MKQLLTYLLLTAICCSCNTTHKTPTGQTVLLQGKNSRVVLGNTRKFAEKARKDSMARAAKMEFSNGHK
jgi:hypothetical protein